MISLLHKIAQWNRLSHCATEGLQRGWSQLYICVLSDIWFLLWPSNKCGWHCSWIEDTTGVIRKLISKTLLKWTLLPRYIQVNYNIYNLLYIINYITFCVTSPCASGWLELIAVSWLSPVSASTSLQSGTGVNTPARVIKKIVILSGFWEFIRTFELKTQYEQHQ